MAASTDERSPLLGGIQPESENANPKVLNDETLGENASGYEDGQQMSSVVVWMVLPILLMGVFLSNAVSSVVIATNQHIASEFNALSSAAWLLTAYSLAQAATQPLYGKLSDIYGRRKCIIFCWVVFALGCLLVGVGQTFWQVILGRAVSGVGSAGKIALTSIIVADLVPLRQVAHYRAYVNLTATIARSIGGPIGAWLAGSVGWRVCFLTQVPIGLLGLSLVLWKLPEPKGTLDSATCNRTKSALSRVDFLGAISLVLTVVTGLMTVELASKGYPGLIIGIMCASFAMIFTLFALIEKCVAKEPILPLYLMIKRDVLVSYAIVFFQTAGQFGLLYAIPIYFQVIGRESVSLSGTRIVPVVVGNAVGTVLSGKLITKLRRYKVMTVFGNLAGLVGFLAIFLRWRGSTQWYDSLLVAFPGMGMGIIQSTTFVHLAASLDGSELAIAGSTWFLAQSAGVLLGASVSTAAITNTLRSRLESSLDYLGNKQEIIENVMSNTDYTAKLPPSLWKLVANAYVHALLTSNVLSIALIAMALMVTILMKERGI